MAAEAYRLGKLPPKFNGKSFLIVEFLNPDIPIPGSYDFDARRAEFSRDSYGNAKWNNCVIAARAHQLLRLERIEQFRTLPLTEHNVIEEYKRETELQHGKKGDQGLVVLDALEHWRDPGWQIHFTARSIRTNFRISAYGRIDPSDKATMRRAMYLCTGAQIGFQLPKAVKGKTTWDVGEGKGYERGSWGGQLVFAKRFDRESVYVISWGNEIRVTNEFIDTYADEAWAVVHDIDGYKAKATLDVEGLQKQLSQL
jgi:hypothetical protein